MTAGQLIIDADTHTAAERALNIGAALPGVVTQDKPIALYGCVFADEPDALVLGRYQRAHQVLPSLDARALRRSTGGASARAGAGIAYVALSLRDRSSLMSCPPGRLLNRNVRGVLQGLRLLGVPANYFGRDFLSIGVQPALLTAWDAREDGSVLLEFFISLQRLCFLAETELAYPPRQQPALRGREPVTLGEAGFAGPAQQLFERLADGHSKLFGVSWETVSAPLPAHPQEFLAGHGDEDHRALRWSALREEASGYVGAAVALDDAGRIQRVCLAGDFFAHRACEATLNRMLLGATPTPSLVGRAVDTALTRPEHDVEGVRSLRTFQDAILEAAGFAIPTGGTP